MPQSGRVTRSDAGQARSNFHDKEFRAFQGMNSQAKRQAIGDDEFAWLENVMPIGHGNAVVVPGPSAPLCTVPHGEIYFMKGFNRSGLNYMFMATTTGHAYECSLDGPSFILREITTPGSPELGPSEVDIDQWKNERIVIVDPVKGFFDWDGTTLTRPSTVISITVLSGGVYTAIPTVSFSGGGGSGAAATANLGLNGTQTITAAGTGYLVGDILTLSGGTSTTPGKVKVTTIGGGGAVTAVSVFDPGSYSVLPAAPVATTGSVGGVGCTITPSYAVFSLTITNHGTGYVSAPAVAFSAGSAAATAFLVGAPSGAKRVASFAGRVWVASGRLLAWTAPNTYNDFLSTGAGSKIVTDSTLDSYIAWLQPANNFLYYGGADSVNIIGDVQTDANGSTIFSDTNLSANIGTLASITVTPYFRQILFMNTSGIYSLAGAAPTKISDAMDGVLQNTDFHGIISGATMILNNIMCAAFLVLYNPTRLPSTANNSRPLLLVYFNKKWFVANQDTIGSRITVIAGGRQNDANSQVNHQNIYATDGLSLFELFAVPEAAVSWELQTKLWDMGQQVKGKEVNALALEFDGLGGNLVASVDMLQKEKPYASSNPYNVTFDTSVDWQNSLGAVVTWTGPGAIPVLWESDGYAMLMQDVEGFGKYVGLTLSSTQVSGTITSLLLRYALREDM